MKEGNEMHVQAVPPFLSITKPEQEVLEFTRALTSQTDLGPETASPSLLTSESSKIGDNLENCQCKNCLITTELCFFLM